ncbi:MAG TPA: 2-hydroxyacid dehydrogenase [Burkholderiales bacterium]|nr:2-hydroxyacid dehydrogenase [Burkholderiales bacterium]
MTYPQGSDPVRVVFRFDASEALIAKVEARSGDGIEIRCCPEAEDAAYAALLPRCQVLWHVLKPVTEDQIARAAKLRLVQKIGSGVNTIAVEACRARGIAVCNLPGSNSRAVAEMALLLMFACLRRLRALDHAVREAGGWTRAAALQDGFAELAGRTVGLVGYGAVPRLLAPMLEALGAKVLYWSRSVRNRELDALLAEADIVSLHLPLTPETERLFDARRLARMKRGAILINTARGALVDETALCSALASNQLAAAGLDVFAEEPVPPDHPLLALPGVVASPHLAWLTQETLERSLAAALDNVRRLRDGAALLNRVA